MSLDANASEKSVCAWCHIQLDPNQPWSAMSPPRCRACVLGQEKRRLHRQIVRTKQAGVQHTLTLEQWIKTLDYFQWRCARCANSFELLDHVVPLDQQGGTTALNCVPACKACNAAKLHHSPERVALSKVLIELHTDISTVTINNTSANALSLRYVMAYVRAIRVGIGLSQDTLAQRLKVSLRTWSRYESDPPDAMPSAALLIRLMAVLPVRAADMVRLLEADASNDLVALLAEEALLSVPSTDAAYEQMRQISTDLLRLNAALRADDQLRQAVNALARGWSTNV